MNAKDSPDNKMSDVEARRACRICGTTGLHQFLSLGDQPCANAFLLAEARVSPEPRYPLGLCICPGCELIQLTHVVPASLLFSDYVYFSSVSDRMAAHFAELGREVAERFVPEGALVVEIGSNDGILLQSLLKSHVRLLGVDPAESVAEMARARGVPTVVDFFSARLARRLRQEHGAASAILANNVLGHIDDLHETMRGIDHLAAPDGVLVFEVPYVVELLENALFDTIYHEHVSYFGVRPLVCLLDQYGFEMTEVRRVPVHGGSLRIFARRRGVQPVHASVRQFLLQEERMRIKDEGRLQKFAADVQRIRDELRSLVSQLCDEGARVAGYTAPAKGNVLLNYCELGPDKILYLADATPAKQGRFTPGMGIPVRSPEYFREDAPQYALLLAWNHKAEVLQRESAYRKAGGRFIVPLPRIEIL